MGKIRHPGEEAFYEAVLSLRTIEDCRLFFEDISTIKELQDISQRFEVAKLLSEGQSYLQISAKTGASTATIGRVNKCLNYGSGGYEIALKKTNLSEEGSPQ